MKTLSALMMNPSDTKEFLEDLAKHNAEVEIEFLGERHSTEVLAYYNHKRNILALGTGSNPEHLLHYNPEKNKFFYIDSVPDESAPTFGESSQIKKISKDVITNIPVSIYLVRD